jgi:hypothetical protein
VLGFHPKRSKRVGDFREFNDDCIATHESLVGADVGPMVKLGKLDEFDFGNMPTAPLKKDFTEEHAVMHFLPLEKN